MPTNAIGPATDTEPPASSTTRTPATSLMANVLWPSQVATSSPNVSRSMCLAATHATIRAEHIGSGRPENIQIAAGDGTDEPEQHLVKGLPACQQHPQRERREQRGHGGSRQRDFERGEPVAAEGSQDVHQCRGHGGADKGKRGEGGKSAHSEEGGTRDNEKGRSGIDAEDAWRRKGIARDGLHQRAGHGKAGARRRGDERAGKSGRRDDQMFLRAVKMRKRPDDRAPGDMGDAERDAADDAGDHEDERQDESRDFLCPCA